MDSDLWKIVFGAAVGFAIVIIIGIARLITGRRRGMKKPEESNSDD